MLVAGQDFDLGEILVSLEEAEMTQGCLSPFMTPSSICGAPWQTGGCDRITDLNNLRQVSPAPPVILHPLFHPMAALIQDSSPFLSFAVRKLGDQIQCSVGIVKASLDLKHSWSLHFYFLPNVLIFTLVNFFGRPQILLERGR